MSIQARISTLQNKLYEISNKIQKSYNFHVSDEKIAKLKKRRLMLKDKLETLRKKKVFESA